MHNKPEANKNKKTNWPNNQPNKNPVTLESHILGCKVCHSRLAGIKGSG